MTQTVTAPNILAAAACTLVAMAALCSQANAVTVREHRGMSSAPQPSSPLPCGSFKYCAKQGVIVRDHRTGATPGGK